MCVYCVEVLTASGQNWFVLFCKLNRGSECEMYAHCCLHMLSAQVRSQLRFELNNTSGKRRERRRERVKEVRNE